MLKKLRRQNQSLYYYYREGEKIYGAPLSISGDLSGIRGDLSDISGNLSGIRGDINDCQITDEERKAGIKIEDLIKEEK